MLSTIMLITRCSTTRHLSIHFMSKASYLPITSNNFFRLRNLCHDICISNAQYCHLSAQRNLWREILEFWACGVNFFIVSLLCGYYMMCAMIWRA